MTRAKLVQSDPVPRIAMPIVIFAAGVVAMLWFLSEPLDSQVEVRVTNLQDVVGSQQDLDTTKAAAEYLPKVKGRIDDLAMPAAEILRQLPGVASVDQPLKPAQVSDRLIHLRD